MHTYSVLSKGMDHSLVLPIMDYIGKDGFSEVSSLFSSEQDIIQQIHTVCPSFDIKKGLISMLHSARILSPLVNTPSYDLYIFMRAIDGIESYTLSTMYNGFSIALHCKGHLDTSVIKSRYPDGVVIDDSYEPVSRLTSDGSLIPSGHSFEIRISETPQCKEIIMHTKLISEHLQQYVYKHHSDLYTVVMFNSK